MRVQSCRRWSGFGTSRYSGRQAKAVVGCDGGARFVIEILAVSQRRIAKIYAFCVPRIDSADALG